MIIVIILPKFYTQFRNVMQKLQAVFTSDIFPISHKNIWYDRYNHPERIINAKSDPTKYRGLSVQ